MSAASVVASQRPMVWRMQFAVNIFQLVGALVTFLGLARAYTRSAYGMGLLRWISSSLTRRRRDLISEGHQVLLSGSGTLSADAYARFDLDSDQSVEGQLAQLADYARELRALFPHIGQEMVRLEREIGATREHADYAAAQALAAAKGHLQDFEADQIRTEVLDLRLAILGLFISFVGTLVAFWA